MLDLRDGKDEVDDIDHLGNRRVRSVGGWKSSSNRCLQNGESYKGENDYLGCWISNATRFN